MFFGRRVLVLFLASLALWPFGVDADEWVLVGYGYYKTPTFSFDDVALPSPRVYGIEFAAGYEASAGYYSGDAISEFGGIADAFVSARIASDRNLSFGVDLEWRSLSFGAIDTDYGTGALVFESIRVRGMLGSPRPTLADIAQAPDIAGSKTIRAATISALNSPFSVNVRNVFEQPGVGGRVDYIFPSNNLLISGTALYYDDFDAEVYEAGFAYAPSDHLSFEGGLEVLETVAGRGTGYFARAAVKVPFGLGSAITDTPDIDFLGALSVGRTATTDLAGGDPFVQLDLGAVVSDDLFFTATYADLGIGVEAAGVSGYFALNDNVGIRAGVVDLNGEVTYFLELDAILAVANAAGRKWREATIPPQPRQRRKYEFDFGGVAFGSSFPIVTAGR